MLINKHSDGDNWIFTVCEDTSHPPELYALPPANLGPVGEFELKLDEGLAARLQSKLRGSALRQFSMTIGRMGKGCLAYSYSLGGIGRKSFKPKKQWGTRERVNALPLVASRRVSTASLGAGTGRGGIRLASLPRRRDGQWVRAGARAASALLAAGYRPVKVNAAFVVNIS